MQYGRRAKKYAARQMKQALYRAMHYNHMNKSRQFLFLAMGVGAAGIIIGAAVIWSIASQLL